MHGVKENQYCIGLHQTTQWRQCKTASSMTHLAYTAKRKKEPDLAAKKCKVLMTPVFVEINEFWQADPNQ